MPIKLELNGFEQQIRKLEAVGKKADATVHEAATAAAAILQSELKSEMAKADETGGMSRLISRMPAPEVEQSGGVSTARAGYRKGEYNPDNISDGYKAVFLNYGTPRRSKHGKVRPRGFIDKAKKAAKPKITAECKKIFDRAIKEL